MNSSIPEIIIAHAQEAGFDYIGTLDSACLNVRPEVREMCAADRCQNYNRNWSCPPNCGGIEQYQELFDRHSKAILVQSVGQLEDSFDFEGMIEAGRTHTKRFISLMDAIRADEKLSASVTCDPAFLGAGECMICESCAYPEPCRFPSKRLVSMEAAGLVVNEVCEMAGIGYNHGANTVSFTGCVLI